MDVELEILTNGMEGEGIARFDGKVCFVENAIEGEIVLASKEKQGKNFNRYKTVSIIKKSANRIVPKCPYFNDCGGCSMQHISYDKTLEIKRQNIINLLAKTKLNTNVENVIKSPREYNYRNKISMYKTPNNTLGFFQKNSKNIIPINNCELAEKPINKLIKILNNYLLTNIDFALYLKGISIRYIDEIFIINLVLNKKINLDNFEKYLKVNKINYSLYFCINNNSNIPTYPLFFVGGRSEVYACEFDIKYPVYPMSFLQVNSEVKTLLYNEVLNNIKEECFVIDAYAGAGLLSAMISKRAKEVFAVEIDEQANKASQSLCVLNRINDMESILGDCAKVIPNIIKNNDIDTCVLDPARRGVDNGILEAIINGKIAKVIYISCNPATLVRDLKVLCDGGFEIKYIQPFDMFPWTSEVEAMAILERVKD